MHFEPVEGTLADYQLFDVREESARDVASEHPDVVEHMKGILESFLQREPNDAFSMRLPPPRSARLP